MLALARSSKAHLRRKLELRSGPPRIGESNSSAAVFLPLLAVCSILVGPLAAVRAIEKEVVVAVYQGVCREGDFTANLATARKVIAEAQGLGAQFLAFPETFLSGYESRESVARGTRPLDDGELKQFIADSAAHDMVIMIGLARRAAEGVYNTVLVIHRGKLLGTYDKILLTGGDSQQLGFLPGRTVPVFSAHGVRFAVIICHDTSFPHVALAARLQGAELLFTPHYNAIGEAAVDDHRRSVRNCHIGLAAQMKLVVARSNIVKTGQPGLVSYGGSFILSPLGEPLAEAKLFKTELISAKITPAMFRGPYVWADYHEVPEWLRQSLASLLTEARPPSTEAELRFWLENMLLYHRYTPGEACEVTGLTLDELAAARKRFDFPKDPPRREANSPLRMLPYPGGRHPRIGFLEGAVMPQRETKFSVFTPWDEASYVVVDVPEAIWSNLGLLYLAHSHVATIWDRQGVRLPRLEWSRGEGGALTAERTLPNGVAFGATARPTATEVRMELWLRNGTAAPLTDLRVQNCVMLKAAAGFQAQSLENKIFGKLCAAVRSEDGRRWIITAWEPGHRCWGNEQVPCLHADPKFPDCPPGQTVRLRGWLSFYEGSDVEAEFQRIAQAL